MNIFGLDVLEEIILAMLYSVGLYKPPTCRICKKPRNPRLNCSCCPQCVAKAVREGRAKFVKP